MTAVGTPAELPDATAVSEAAAAFTAIATQTTEATDAVASGWAGLSAPGVYQAPEAHRVHVAMDAPKAVAEIVAGDVRQVQRVLDAYATVLTDLAARRATLLSDIGSHETAVREAADAPADADPDGTTADALATETTDLSGRVRTFNADVESADADCADGLRSLAK